MNLFDLVAGLVLVVSALIGFSRGVILEVVALFAFTTAAGASVYLLPFTAPLARQSLHPPWLANAAAIGGAFLIIYLGVRLFGANVSRAIRGQSTLGTLDRTVGFAFGVVRALAVLGFVYLVFSATPLGQPPPLLTHARLYPLARGAGLTLASLAPGGLREMEGFGAGLKSHMDGGDPSAEPALADPTTAADAPSPPMQIDAGSTPSPHHRRPAPAQVE